MIPKQVKQLLKGCGKKGCGIGKIGYSDIIYLCAKCKSKAQGWLEAVEYIYNNDINFIPTIAKLKEVLK